MTISRTLERIAIAVASLVLSIGLIALLSGYFASHDPAGVSGGVTVLGQAFPDLGHARLRPGQPRPPYNSDPPTSGAHIPRSIARDQVVLSDDQLLSALEAGDVVIEYGGRQPPAGLQELARSIMKGRFTPELATAGGAVILGRRPGAVGLIGLAWAHMVHVSAPSDSLLRDFADYWLGRGAPGS